MDEASDEDDERVISVSRQADSEPEREEEDDEDGLDAIDEDEQLSKSASAAPAATPAVAPAQDEENSNEDGDDDVSASLGARPPAASTSGSAGAPSVLQEEREARENGDRDDGYGSDYMTDEDPGIVRHEEKYTKSPPIIRERGKSKPCFKAPFSACVHMAFETETGEAIKPFKMTAERYCEPAGKNQDTTKEIITQMSPAKLAQEVCVFLVRSNKSQSPSALRRYAAFVRVEITDFEGATAGFQETIGDGTPLYQLHPAEFSRLFKGEHGLKLPKSLVPTSNVVVYSNLTPPAEAEVKPEGWIVCPSVGDGSKTSKRSSKAKASASAKKQKTGDAGDAPAAAEAAEQAPAPEPALAPAAGAPIAQSAYKDYAFVPAPAAPAPAPRAVPAPAPDTAVVAVNRFVANGNGANSADDFASRSETYTYDLSNRSAWPVIAPGFEFNDRYSKIEITFKVYTK
jgi:hypothetical protein